MIFSLKGRRFGGQRTRFLWAQIWMFCFSPHQPFDHIQHSRDAKTLDGQIVLHFSFIAWWSKKLSNGNRADHGIC